MAASSFDGFLNFSGRDYRVADPRHREEPVNLKWSDVIVPQSNSDPSGNERRKYLQSPISPRSGPEKVVDRWREN
jgi:hypothetical protein